MSTCYLIDYENVHDGGLKGMVDTINAPRTPIYAINIGVAASAASLVYISGHNVTGRRRRFHQVVFVV